MKASIAQWQSVGLVNQRSWVQSSLEADIFASIYIFFQLELDFLVLAKIFFYPCGDKYKNLLTPTWFEHAAFWSGVRRATVAPRSHIGKRVKMIGSTEIWTRIAGFKVQSANHYTIEPQLVCWIHFLGQDYQLSVRLLSRALSLSKLFGTHLLIIRKTKKNLLVSCRVRTGDLVRVKHTW